MFYSTIQTIRWTQLKMTWVCGRLLARPTVAVLMAPYLAEKNGHTQAISTCVYSKGSQKRAKKKNNWNFFKCFHFLGVLGCWSHWEGREQHPRLHRQGGRGAKLLYLHFPIILKRFLSLFTSCFIEVFFRSLSVCL